MVDAASCEPSGSGHPEAAELCHRNFEDFHQLGARCGYVMQPVRLPVVVACGLYRALVSVRSEV